MDLVLAGWYIVRHSGCFQLSAVVTRCCGQLLPTVCFFFSSSHKACFGEVFGLEKHMDFIGSVPLLMHKESLLFFGLDSPLQDPAQVLWVSPELSLALHMEVCVFCISTCPLSSSVWASLTNCHRLGGL